MPSWKVKGVDRVFNAMDGSLIDRNNWEEIVGRCHAHGGTESHHWFMHSKL